MTFTLLLLFTATAQAEELEELLENAEQFADMSNGFALRCENDIELEKTSATEDCDKFLETYGLWSRADDRFQSRFSRRDIPEDERWKDDNQYRLKAYKHLLNRTKRTAIKINAMIRKIP